MKKHINYTQYASKNIGRIRCLGRNRVVPLQSLTPELWTLLDAGRHVVVGPIELFFDLVYVFTIIQLSHTLLGELT